MIVLLHGWSDSSRGFQRLARRIRTLGIEDDVREIWLGDYVSMDDEVTFDDLAAAMEDAWKRERLPAAARSVDVVVHSTGALVVRHWMTRFRTPENNPVHRLLMLAPANFGSHLAHKGRSFFGRIAKGFSGPKPFQTGTHVLRGLELASPFSFHLAMRDRFGDRRWYGADRVKCTVLVGTEGYSGISAAANEVGGDGTVRVSTANLNPAHVTLDFEANPTEPRISVTRPNGRTAFARLSNLNHSTIAVKKDVAATEDLEERIRRALTVTDAEFDGYCDDLDAFSALRRRAEQFDTYRQGYQNTVVHLTDTDDHDVDDYFIEFFAKNRSNARASDVDAKITRRLQEDVIVSAHAYKANTAYRSLYVNCHEMRRTMTDHDRGLFLSLTAMPDIADNGFVGYRTLNYDDIGSREIEATDIPAFFAPDRTALVSIRIRRERSEDAFKLSHPPNR
ncbi:MAG: alpha/beta hydrolase [Pseudomonadota bacterium]